MSVWFEMQFHFEYHYRLLLILQYVIPHMSAMMCCWIFEAYQDMNLVWFRALSTAKTRPRNTNRHTLRPWITVPCLSRTHLSSQGTVIKGKTHVIALGVGLRAQVQAAVHRGLIGHQVWCGKYCGTRYERVGVLPIFVAKNWTYSNCKWFWIHFEFRMWFLGMSIPICG